MVLEMHNLIDKINFIRRGANTKRYHTVPTIKDNTVGHHSFGVAWLCSLIDPAATPELLLAALAHDLAEQVTGDISSPTKRAYPELATMVQELEWKTLSAHGLGFELKLTEQQARTLKMADRLDGMLFCFSEMQLGNESIKEVYNRYLSYVELMVPTGNERTIFNAIRQMVVSYEQRER